MNDQATIYIKNNNNKKVFRNSKRKSGHVS